MTETISFKVDRTLLLKIDGLTQNRSDFIRSALEEKVRREAGVSKSAWDALAGVEGLGVDIRPAPGRLRKIRL